MSSLRVICINIEFDRHLDTVLPFLKSEPWDVVLLNEFLASDVPRFEDELKEDCFFVPQTIHPHETKGDTPFGHGIFSRPPTIYKDLQYAGPMGEIMRFDSTSPETQFATNKYFLVVAEVTKDGVEYKLGLTHFPWTPNGEPDDIQRVSVKSLLELVKAEGELALFGDFNAPRGKEIFSALASELKDNIPPQYETSLDENLHRKGKITLMVDGCFTTPAYRAKDVELAFGISDHAAVLATIEKTAV